MSIGIIGAGALGSNVARLLAKSGVSATIANSRGPESLAGLVGELGPSIKAGTVEEAASAEIVLVAVRWVDLEKALDGLPAWNGRVVIDATNAVQFLDPDSPDAKDPNNPLAAYGIKAIDLGGKHSSEVFREFVRGARVSCSTRATMSMRRPRFARSSKGPAVFLSTLAGSIVVDHWPGYHLVRLRASISSGSDGQRRRARPKVEIGRPGAPVGTQGRRSLPLQAP